MKQLHVLDGDPLEADLTPALLGAAHYREKGDFLGMLECLALLAYQVGRGDPVDLLDPEEVDVLDKLERFHHGELARMHHTLVSSEFAHSTLVLDTAAISACCRASELHQRERLMEIFGDIEAGFTWTLTPEWSMLQGSDVALYQAAVVFTAWLHQRFELHYLARDLSVHHLPSPALNPTLRPFVLRAISEPPEPRIRRIRLAGWRTARMGSQAICASVLCVPMLRDPAHMVEALRTSMRTRTGPFFRAPPAERGVMLTELMFASEA